MGKRPRVPRLIVFTAGPIAGHCPAINENMMKLWNNQGKGRQAEYLSQGHTFFCIHNYKCRQECNFKFFEQIWFPFTVTI